MSRWLHKIELSTQAGLKGDALRAAQRTANTLLGPVRASARAYTTFLNQLRFETFVRMKNALVGRTGKPTIDQLKVIANAVNTATGRGDFGKFEASAENLSTVFFSPRFVRSRFGLLGGEPLWMKGSDAHTRAIVGKMYAEYLAGVAAFYALGMAAGGEVETDPRSSDFGKLRFGDVRIDPLVGLSQITVFSTRMLTGETKTTDGEIAPLRKHIRPLNLFRNEPDTEGPGYGKRDAAKVAEFFLRSKLAPIPGSIGNILTGKDVANREVTLASEAKQLATPLSVKTVMENMQAEGVPAKIALTILSLLGMRSNVYGNVIDEATWNKALAEK